MLIPGSILVYACNLMIECCWSLQLVAAGGGGIPQEEVVLGVTVSRTVGTLAVAVVMAEMNSETRVNFHCDLRVQLGAVVMITSGLIQMEAEGRRQGGVRGNFLTFCTRFIACHHQCLDQAQEQIDRAMTICLEESKPVYISISCYLVAMPPPTFVQDPITLIFSSMQKPVLVARPRFLVAKACNAFVELAGSCGYAFAVMLVAKGLWGAASTLYSAEIVETADASLFAGPSFYDLICVGHSLIFNKKKAIIAEPERVTIPNMPVLWRVRLKKFLEKPAKRLDHNTSAYENYQRICVPEALTLQSELNEDLKVNVLVKHIQKMLLGDTTPLAEAGDAWFHCQKLKLPKGLQLPYASIGWSIGATLGLAQAEPDKRVIACIGDGNFLKVTFQPGDWVWVHLLKERFPSRRKSKLQPRCDGSFQVLTKINDNAYKINLLSEYNVSATFNVADLSPFELSYMTWEMCFVNVISHASLSNSVNAISLFLPLPATTLTPHW
ncbi:hypothetical protein P3X46_031189 [Hevea brasiliensis]|uniref:pyruvate decarboxylase n=1 Tax=Hevea brasiliensis TaxID=3981 RepID=A0ABQ9KJI4_HEVBR|nr:hypothetical protein P3X46_031189 [Hevea brasiliensis]